MTESMSTPLHRDIIPDEVSAWIGGGSRSHTMPPSGAVFEATASPSSLPQDVASNVSPQRVDDAVALSRQSTEGILTVPVSDDRMTQAPTILLSLKQISAVP